MQEHHSINGSYHWNQFYMIIILSLESILHYNLVILILQTLKPWTLSRSRSFSICYSVFNLNYLIQQKDQSKGTADSSGISGG